MWRRSVFLCRYCLPQWPQWKLLQLSSLSLGTVSWGANISVINSFLQPPSMSIVLKSASRKTKLMLWDMRFTLQLVACFWHVMPNNISTKILEKTEEVGSRVLQNFGNYLSTTWSHVTEESNLNITTCHWSFIISKYWIPWSLLLQVTYYIFHRITQTHTFLWKMLPTICTNLNSSEVYHASP